MGNDPRVEMALLTFDFISQCEPSIEDAKNAASKAIDSIEAYEGSGARYKMTA
ncbi:hypothetical protein [Novosphingobium nitrogenifigens]|uniref:hypothetical protein n=1 Tax=Novosphingobium nitrogenifigens TaxID=378548 RepID=UPI0012F4C8F0|nr:hypothetical protein [Novosphingobium nitrogenifigens]